VLKDKEGARAGNREWESEKKRETEHGGIILSHIHTEREREAERVSVCVCVCEREREREDVWEIGGMEVERKMRRKEPLFLFSVMGPKP